MGILFDAVAILFGGFFGNKLQKNKTDKDYTTLGIGIIIIAIVGFIENMYKIDGEKISSSNLLIILFAYLIGNKIGEFIHLEDWLSNLSKTKNPSLNAFIDSTIFFGIGGLQISGPIALALNYDNGQLILKSFIDAPFAIMFGATYGKIAALASVPVAAIQILILVIAHFSSSFFTAKLIAQLCAFGYIILFFSGFNLTTKNSCKISNINMLPGIFLVIIFNMLTNLTERLWG